MDDGWKYAILNDTKTINKTLIELKNFIATNSRINFFYNREIRAFVAVTLIELHFGYYATLSRLIEMMVADLPCEIEERTKFWTTPKQ